MKKIIQLSLILKNFFMFLAILPLPFALIIWMYTKFPERTLFGISLVNGPIGFMGFSNISISIMNPLSSFARFWGFVAYFPMALLQTYWLWQLKKLFSYYAQGKIFTLETTNCIRRTAWTFFTIAFVSIILDGLLSVILTSNNPVGHRMFSISFGTYQITDILVGLILVVIAWIMNEACRLQEEMELTV